MIHRHFRSEAWRWQHQLDSITTEIVLGTDGEEITLCTTNLQIYLEQMRDKQPQNAQLVERVLVEEQSQKPEGIDACIYVDEYVPGNILAPDNRRKSYCIYFTFLTLARY